MSGFIFQSAIRERFQNLDRRLQLLLLAMLSILCVSCSTPPVPNSSWDDGTAYWSYQNCLASQSGNQRACNMIGVTNGSSYTEWNYGTNPYVSPYQPTDSIFQGRFFRAARAVSYQDYLNALPADVQAEMRSKWLELAAQ